MLWESRDGLFGCYCSTVVVTDTDDLLLWTFVRWMTVERTCAYRVSYVSQAYIDDVRNTYTHAGRRSNGVLMWDMTIWHTTHAHLHVIRKRYILLSPLSLSRSLFLSLFLTLYIREYKTQSIERMHTFHTLIVIYSMINAYAYAAVNLTVVLEFCFLPAFASDLWRLHLSHIHVMCQRTQWKKKNHCE